MKSALVSLTALAAMIATAAGAQAVTIKEETPGLLKKAKITAAAATATARAKVPGGVVQSGEIEQEDGKLVFVFDIRIAGKSGIEEVSVDALTGALVSAVHESPADEAREAQADRNKAASAKAPTKAAPGKAAPVAPAAKRKPPMEG